MPPKKTEDRFSIGDEVMGKWPKTNLFFQGKVIDMNDVEYLVRFDDEDKSELAIKFSNVRNIFERATRSRSRGRTPVRKSPGRKSPGRQKSPGRPKSPGRQKSPGRPKKTTEKNSVSEVKEEEVSPKKESNNSVHIKKVEVNNVVERTARSGTRQSARIASIIEKTDKVNNIKVDVRSVTKSIEDGKKFSARLMNVAKRGAMCGWETSKAIPLVVLVLFIPLLFTQMCTKAKCGFEFPTFSKRVEYYFDRKALYPIVGFFLAQLLLALVPIGKVVSTPSGAKIRCNAFFAVLVTFASIPTMMTLKYDVLSVYTLYYRHMMVVSTCIGVLISLALYIKSFYARRSDLNPAGKSGYWITDLVEGREINPRIRTFDIKFFLFRIAFLSIIMVNLLISIKEFQSRSKNYSPVVIMSCAFQIFYACDLAWFEESFLTTFEYNKQGTGLFSVTGYLCLPFIILSLPRFVVNYGASYPWYCLVGIAILNLIGYILLRGSMSQKHAFRTNPSSPALSHLESLPSSAGSRLLVSGWWGLVRHPNYVGDLIINFSWSLLCGFHHAFPWVVFGLTAVFLFLRIFQVEASCKKKYGLAWSSYTARVKYRLIPKVF